MWAVLELMVFVGSDRSGGPERCGASTLALSQLIDLNILEFHTLLEPLENQQSTLPRESFVSRSFHLRSAAVKSLHSTNKSVEYRRRTCSCVRSHNSYIGPERRDSIESLHGSRLHYPTAAHTRHVNYRSVSGCQWYAWHIL